MDAIWPWAIPPAFRFSRQRARLTAIAIFGITILVILLSGCAVDGGGRGTGIGTSAITGNIAPSTSAASVDSLPVCASIGTSAMVSVRNTNLAAPIESDCSFALSDVPPGDVTLDFEAGEATTSLTVNNVPPDAVVVLTDVRLRETATDVAGISVVPETPGGPLDARIVADPPKGLAPLEVHFSALTAADAAVKVQWDFGDGSAPSTALNPTHVYRKPGEYVVGLRAGALNHSGRDVYAVVRVRPPESLGDLLVDLAAQPSSGTLPLEVELTANVKNAVEPVAFRWDFGDGTKLEEGNRVEKHTFTPSGLLSASSGFLVVVTARDSAGREAGDSFPIVPRPVAIAPGSSPIPKTAAPGPIATPTPPALSNSPAVRGTATATLPATSTPTANVRPAVAETLRPR